MGRAKNTINPAEVSSTPIKVKYTATYSSGSLATYNITLTSGSNFAYNVTMSSDERARMSNYRLIRQLYYQYYLTGSVLGSASFFDPWWQSTAADNSGNETKYYFPTGSEESFLLFSIPTYQFGEQISRQSFIITSSLGTYNIVDDGNGNLVDASAGKLPVGNIFYAQGIAVITNQDYLSDGNFLITDPDSDIYITENFSDIIIE